MSFPRKSIFFIVLTLLLVGIYGVVVFADENSGGYYAGESTNPTCAPNSAFCFVKAVGGEDTYVQYNNNGVLGGDENFIWDYANKDFFVGDFDNTTNGTGLYVGNTFGFVTMGDLFNTHNSTVFQVNDSDQRIVADVDGEFEVRSADGFNRWLRVATDTHNVILGDYNNNFNGTLFTVDDVNQDIIGTLNDEFYLQDSSLNKFFSAEYNVGNPITQIGDLGGVGNYTLLTIDDSTQDITGNVVIDSGTGEMAGLDVSLGGAQVVYRNGIGGIWGFQGGALGGQTLIHADTTTWTWPNADGNADDVLTTDGNGTLSWGEVSSSITVDATYNNVFTGTIGAGINLNGAGGAIGDIFIGRSAGNANTIGYYNVFIGDGTGANNIDGNYNVFTGMQSGYSNSSGSNNTFYGTQSGYSNTTGFGNTFSGSGAGYSNIDGSFNVFSGYNAGNLNTSGGSNVFSGYGAGYSNTTGSNNVFSGPYAGFYQQISSGQIAIGRESLMGSLNTALNTGSQNTAIGFQAGYLNEDGTNNVFLGYGAGDTNVSGGTNTIIGSGADVALAGTTGSIALGYGAVADSNEFAIPDTVTNWKFAGDSYTLPTAFPSVSGYALTSTNAGVMSWALSGNVTGSGTSPRIPYWSSATALTDDASFTRLANRGILLQDNSTFKNVFIGNTTGVAGATGAGNVALGTNALDALTSGTQNTAIGENASTAVQSGGHNVAIGNMAGFENVSNSNSVYIGREAGRRMQADESIAIGYGAMFGSGTPANNTGQRNIALGRSTLESLTSGQNNIAIGYGSGASIANGAENILMGQSTGSAIVSTSGNVFIGNSNSTTRTSGNNNTIIGAQAGGGAGTGATNVGLGYSAFSILTSGAENVAIGGSTAGTLTTGSQNVIIGQSANVAAAGTTGAIALGYQASAATNEFALPNAITNFKFQGDSYTLPTAFPGINDYALTSTTAGVMSWTDVAAIGSDENLKSNIIDLDSDILSKLLNVRTISYTLNNDESEKTRIGFIAQDLEQYFPELVTTRADGYKAVYYAQMSSVIVEAIREMNFKIDGIQELTNETFLSKLTAWFADAANGIGNFFAREVHTERICVAKSDGNEVCVTGDELESALGGTVNSGGSGGGDESDGEGNGDIPPDESGGDDIGEGGEETPPFDGGEGSGGDGAGDGGDIGSGDDGGDVLVDDGEPEPENDPAPEPESPPDEGGDSGEPAPDPSPEPAA